MRMTIAIAASVRRSSPSVFGFGGCKRSPKSQLKMFIALILSKILIQKRTIAKIMIGRQLRLFASLPICSFYIPSNAKTRTKTTKERHRCINLSLAQYPYE